MVEVISPRLAWALILVSGTLEIAFAAAMQASQGFTRPVPAVLAIASGGVSVYLMSLTLAVIPIGTAYAVWAGVGAVGTAAMGIWWLGEVASPMRLLCIGLVVAGIAGLHWLET